MAPEKVIGMDQKFIEIFTGFSDNYGQADMQRLEIDPVSKKQKPEYRWAQMKNYRSRLFRSFKRN